MDVSLSPIVKLLFGDANPGVTKVKNTEYDSVYACECKSMLQKDRHYMFVIGSIDIIPVGSNVRIEDILNISCIQFRTFQEPLPQQVIVNAVDFDRNRVNEVRIRRYSVSQGADGLQKISEYMFEYDNRPYNVHIFHSTDSDYEFISEGTLLNALITWDTMIVSSIDVRGRGGPPPPPGPPLRHQHDTACGSETNYELEYERRPRNQVRRPSPPQSYIPPTTPTATRPPVPTHSHRYTPPPRSVPQYAPLPPRANTAPQYQPPPRPSYPPPPPPPPPHPQRRYPQYQPLPSQSQQEPIAADAQRTRVSFSDEPTFNPRPTSTRNTSMGVF